MPTFELKDIMNFERTYRKTLMNKISGLKSVNLIGSKSAESISNVSIFNSVVHIGANPPLLGFIMRPLTVERHTYENIKSTGFYTINHVSESIHRNAHRTSAKFEAGTSEFDECGLTEKYMGNFAAPFVGESQIQIGLSFQEEHLIEANKTILIIGKVEKLLLPDHAVKDDGDIDLSILQSVCVGGLDTYYSSKKIGRCAYARPHLPIQKN